jgi:formylglycine-generating enzyme required for sulfatase activity/cytochrome c5
MVRRFHPVLVLAVSLLAASCVREQTGTRADNEFRDCPDCPVMLRIPPGRFTMGSPPAETDNRGWPPQTGGNERPVHEVAIGYAFALGKHEVTRGQYAAFVAATGRTNTGGCVDFRAGFANSQPVAARNWESPGFEQTDEHPASCVSWQDAQAYTAWLAAKTGQPYRLPSEAEWEYAGRAGATTLFPWGDALGATCTYANARAAANWTPSKPGEEGPFPCDDGYENSAPVGSFRPNGFGLYDMIGNVFEWTADCNHTGFDGAPVDGSAWIDDPACVFRIMKGGSFANSLRQARLAARVGRPVSGRAPMLGFRVARSLDGAGPAAVVAASVSAVEVAGVPPEDVALFNTRCAACHVDGRSFAGVYGRDQATVEQVIREGGTNSMSMPAWGGELSADEIRRLAVYVRRAAGWE